MGGETVSNANRMPRWLLWGLAAKLAIITALVIGVLWYQGVL